MTHPVLGEGVGAPPSVSSSLPRFADVRHAVESSSGRPPAVHTKLQRSHSNNAASDGGGGASAGNAFSETTSREASDAEVAAAAAAQQAMAEQQAAEDASRQQAMAEQQAAEEVLRWEGVLDDPAAEAARLTQYKQDRRNRYSHVFRCVYAPIYTYMGFGVDGGLTTRRRVCSI